MKNIARLLFVCLLIVISALSAVAEPKRIELKGPDEIYIHPVTGFQFPPKVWEFKRGDVVQYDQKGLDVSAAYYHLIGISATVYVYPFALPPSGDLTSHFEDCKKAIAQHPGAKLDSEGAIQIFPGKQQHRGLRAAFTFVATDFRNFPKGEVVNSELYLFFTGPNRLLKFRITYPKAQQAVAKFAIEALLNGIVWP